ncbi:MAG: hypothetical protein H6836_01725 [Planctomycetes bacterium]|nr:hypothetical protein [Planctomycetota bacterium]MCB9888265.1 hypothetical protein [Planctomycetota bacterium]
MADRLVFLAGIVQLGISAVSLALPRLLGWREQIAKLDGLLRCVFWTYAGYIVATNVCCGLLSILAASWLTDGTPLARAVCAYIATYWGARTLLQVSSYHRHTPQGVGYRVGEAAATGAFAFCAAVYASVAFGVLS